MGRIKHVYSVATLRRLPAYLRILRIFDGDGQIHVASEQLGRLLHMDAISVRKDLEILKVPGLTGVGYQVRALLDAIESFLGWNNATDALLLGVRGIGQILLRHEGFQRVGLRLVAAFDASLSEQGKTPADYPTAPADLPIFPAEKLPHFARRLNLHLGILCVDEQDAQRGADLMIEGGIRAIWNLTPHPLVLPLGVIQQQLNLAGDLAVLSKKLSELLKSEASHEPLVPGLHG